MKTQTVKILTTLLFFGLLAVPLLQGAPDNRAREQELLAVLKSEATLHEKARACQQLALIGSKASVPVLASLLDREPLSGYARFALEPIDDPSVDDALRTALNRLEGLALRGVVNSIGVRRDVQAIGALQQLVQNTGRGAASEALMALGMIATDEALATVRRVLSEEPAALRVPAADAALTAVDRLRIEQRGDEAIVLYDTIRQADLPEHLRTAATYGAIVSRGDTGVPLLMDLLHDSSSTMVGVALRAARELPGEKVSNALVAAMEKAAPSLQVPLIDVLVARGDGSGRKGIEALTASKDPVVQRMAVIALGEIGDASSVRMLVNRLAENGDAAGSLRILEGEGIDAAILAELARETGGKRMALIEVLADRGYAGAVPALLKATASGDEALTKAAFKALGVLAGPDDVPAMLETMLAAKSSAIAPAAESAIVRVAGGRADAVVAALDSVSSPTARVSLLRILGRIGGKEACATVRKAIADPTPEVNDAAVRALISWPDAHAAEALIGIVKKTENQKHRVLALRGYVRLLTLDTEIRPDTAALRMAEAMTLSKTADTRKAILGALAKVPHRDALELAMSHVADDSLRTEAGLAAATIARSIMGFEAEAAQTAAKQLAASPDQRIAGEGRDMLKQLDRFADAIVAWRISGPYVQAGKDYAALFDIAFEPEKPGARNVKWQPIEAGTHAKYPQVLDLRKALDGDQRVAYALTWIHSESEQALRLEMGSDDGIKAWLNGKLVHANNTARAAIPYTDRVNVVLKPGWNPLLLKITQNQIPWEFCARFRTRDGKPASGLRVDPNHLGEWRLLGSVPKPAAGPPPAMKGTSLFDGKTFTGWEGNLKWFRIEDGAIVGGTLKERIPNNEFLTTTKTYTNFQLRLKLKLVDNKGNAGIQIRSTRISDHHEMIGYQADVAAAYWGGLYDESRRRKFLDKPDKATLARAVKPGQWNEYVIRCEGQRIQLWLNGIQTVDYAEPDSDIPQTGLIGLQIHSGGPSEIWYRDIEIAELPAPPQ